VGRLIIRHFHHEDVADKATFEEEWTADKDYTIHYIWFKRDDGASFTATKVTVWVNRIPLTRDEALARTFGEDPLYGVKWMEPLKAKQPFKYSGTNREGATIDISVELLLEEAE